MSGVQDILYGLSFDLADFYGYTQLRSIDIVDVFRTTFTGL